MNHEGLEAVDIRYQVQPSLSSNPQLFLKHTSLKQVAK